jgi:uncharacterized FAD-dependent dehydrogenase
MERRAAVMGGGKLVAPVQRVTDFLEGVVGGPGSPITSSYRMGVKEAPCHEIYPDYVTAVSTRKLHTSDLLRVICNIPAPAWKAWI